jgi:uncharacterized protein YjdB
MQANPGAGVTISGSGFNATAANNIVYFGAIKAVVTSASSGSLTVTVPTGATHMPVSVNNAASGLTGYSQYSFLPTYDNTGYDASTINFEPKVEFTSGADGHDVAVGDIDGDGKADIVTVNGVSNSISVWRNTGTSGTITLASLAANVDLATQNGPTDVVLVDVDGDGKLDIAVSNNTANSISIFRNISTSGSITAGSFAARVDIAGTNAGPKGIAFADIDDDGKPDMAVACQTANVLNIFKNNSTVGTIAFGPKVNFSAGLLPIKIAFADVNNDGKQDMISADMNSNEISVFRNTSTTGVINATSFATSVVFSTGSSTAPQGLSVGDLNGDGRVDVAVANSSTNSFSVFTNSGATGAITAGSFTRNDFATGAGPVSVSMADVNGDGKPEVVVTNYSASTVSVFRNTTATTGATPTFAAATTMASGVNPRSVAMADVDNDNKADIVLANFAGSLAILRNNPIAQITGTLTVCVAATTTLNNATAGGTWESGNTSVATVGSLTGVVMGVAAGTVTISYNVAGVHVTAVVTVNAPATVGAISGTPSVCVGASTALTNATPGGTWSSTNTAVGTVDASGNVSGLSSGTTIISYVPTGCVTGVATVTVTVDVAPVPGTISGPTNVCSGSNITLTSSGTGGTWSTASTLEAIVGSSTGVVTGSSAGTAIISYTATTACGSASATYTITVDATPTPITGTYSVCVGATTTLSSTPAGGTWTSSNTSIATVGASGVVNGLAAGVTIISYTNGGCTATAVVTVELTPFVGTLSGAAVFCAGTDITITSPASGGSWTSSNTAIATVGTGGIVSGVADGTATISYTVTNGCGTASASTVVTVQVPADPGTISGPSSVCASGSTITLTNTITTGTWSSSNTLAATVSAAGVVTGVDPGTTTISYTVSNTCGPVSATLIVTVNALPDAITGTAVICKDATTTFVTTTGGGSWSSSATSIASVDATGIVTGNGAGVATISYTLVVGCFRTRSVTVNALPGPIAGLHSVCVGSTVTLANINTGGTWVSGNTAVASIGSSSGIVTGLTPGTSDITYTRPVTGCSITTIITVQPLPSAIMGDTVICVGGVDTFSSVPAGGTWSVSVPFFATIGTTSGVFSAWNAGTTRVTYTTAAGCKTSRVITVNQAPGTITGSYTVCEGSTSMLSNSVPFGVWSSSNPSVGIINTSGVVAGVAPGTSSVTYTLPNGCLKSVTVTINPLPAPIAGPSAVCMGSTINLTSAPSGGTWSSTNGAIATASGGTISGVSAGAVAISYTLPTGCKRGYPMTVNPTPGNISGTPVICAGSSILLSSTPLTGTWSSSNTAIATVGSSAGLVTGVAAGTAVITYQLVGTGCYKTKIATVNPLPSAISGPATVCQGASVTLTATPTGGSWSSSAPSIATAISTAGVINGISAGTVVITYRTTAGCTGTYPMTVNPLASAGAILGTPIVCVAGTVTLSATVAGGTWGASALGHISVSTSGVVTGVSAGIDTVSYTVTNMCSTAKTSYLVTVNPLPEIGTIAGEDTVCIGYANVLTASLLGGVWSSSDASVATIAGGMVTGVAAGTATISYSATNTCGTSSATLNVTVIPPVSAGTISGQDTVCYGNTITLTSTTPGGIWSSNSFFVSVGSASGAVTGLAPGVAKIRYVAFNVCSTDTAYYDVYVRYDLDCPTSVAAPASVNVDVRLYPSPTHGIVTVEAPQAGIFAVYTIDGKMIAKYNVGSNSSTINLPGNIAAGMYMCRFTGEDGSTAISRIVYEP